MTNYFNKDQRAQPNYFTSLQSAGQTFFARLKLKVRRFNRHLKMESIPMETRRTVKNNLYDIRCHQKLVKAPLTRMIIFHLHVYRQNAISECNSHFSVL